MPAKSAHLVQRSTTWHCRIDIPIDLRAHYGNRRILSKSLRTGDKILARELASRLTAQWKAEFRAIRDQKLMRGDEWREQSFNYSKSLATFADSAVLGVVGTRPLPPSATEYESGMVISGDGETFSHNLEGGTLAEQLGLINAFAETSREAQESSVLKDYHLSQSDKAELAGILANPASYKPKSPISSSALKAFEQHEQTQTDNARTISMVMSKLKAFSAYLTAEGKPLDYDTVADYLDTISDKRQTRQGHLWALRKFHKWATKTAGTYRDQFKGLTSPYDGHEHARVGKAGGESWTPYTPAEVVQLHTAALAKNDQDLADLIQFASHTGCRIEEIGRISTSTTIFENDQPVAFKVEDSKTAAGIRTIPIHPGLLPLYQRRLEATQDGYLFAGKQDKARKRLNAAQQRFTKLKREQKFTDLHVFHSFRGTVATELEQAGANALVITSIMGHRRGMITFDVYSAGASLKQKSEAIALLKFDF